MKKIVSIMSIFVACASIWAAGFQILEQGASNIGTALAGSTVNANNDASAAFWNPSAAFFVKCEKGRIDASANVVAPFFELKDYSGTYPGGNTPISNAVDGGNAGQLAFIPNFYGMYKITEDWIFTLSVTSTYGLESKYENGSEFIGRYHGVDSQIFNIDINPSIAYKILDNWSVSVGASAQYINGTLTSYTFVAPVAPYDNLYTRVNGHSWSGGFNVGTTYEYMEGGRLGLAYRSQVNHTLSGGIGIGPTGAGQDVTADVTLPNTINFGVYQRLWGDLSSFAVMLDYAWTSWNQFSELAIVGADGTKYPKTTEDWRNAHRVSFGIHYYPEWEKNLVLRLGTCWDQTPVSSADYRTPRIPDSNRYWAACGFGYTYGWLSFDFAYSYIFFDDSSMANVDDPTKGKLYGTYSGSAHVISAQIGIRF